jgi:hypothetical protein
MTPDNLKRVIFDLIKIDGVYERDLLHKLVARYSQRSIEDTLAFLLERRFIKRAGDKIRPIYVRIESARVVYANIAPTAPGTEQTLLTMHSNFEEKRL